MRIISVNRFLLFTLASCFLLAPKIICLDEAVMTSLQSREEYSDNYSESNEDIEEKQRHLNLDELKNWGLKNIVKMSMPTVNKMPSSVANLPLRFGRNFQEERSIKPAANLPLRFGRAFEGILSSYTLPFTHRFERAPFVQSSIHSLANLPQRFGRSLLFILPQEIQQSDQETNK
ncbi:pro-FMRFamide-related neuropeptide VF [Heteronotia binoei]|uniref:pro-FMRFamide-related neuropeptide VF n=1 Tax=Heteronotia binoei TaxID=13085 RepID=UPI00292F937B|nr:pro-FMRFamide-related neuropeptide VF [Heteronotia binoei]